MKDIQVLKPSVYYAEVVQEVAEHSCYGTLGLTALEKGVSKWGIRSTLIVHTPNGLASVFYLNSKGEYVYMIAVTILTGILRIGEIHHINATYQFDNEGLGEVTFNYNNRKGMRVKQYA